MSNNQHTLLHLERKKSMHGKLWDLNVYIDGNKIGTISNGRVETFIIQPGKHLLTVGRGFLLMTSDKIKFEINAGEAVSFTCVSNWGGTHWNIERDYRYAVSSKDLVQPSLEKNNTSNDVQNPVFTNSVPSSLDLLEETNISNEVQIYA